MKLLEQFKREQRAFSNKAALICLGVGVLTALIVMVACGNYYLYSFLLMPLHAPPAFFFFFSFLLCTGLIFYSGGMAHFCFCMKERRTILLFDLFSVLFFILFYVSFIRMAAFIFAFLLIILTGVMLFMGFRASCGESIILTLMHGVLLFFCLLYLLLTAAVMLLN